MENFSSGSTITPVLISGNVAKKYDLKKKIKSKTELLKWIYLAHLARAAGYTDCIFAEGLTPPLDMTQNNLIIRLR